MHVPPRVEVPGPTDDVLPQLPRLDSALWLDEERRRWPAVPDDNALRNDVAARRAHVVLDGTGVAPERVLALDPVVVTAAEEVAAGRNLAEQVARVEMPVGLAEGGVGAITGLSKYDKLEERRVGVVVPSLVSGGCCDRSEAVLRARDGAQEEGVTLATADRDQHGSAFRVPEEVAESEAVAPRPVLLFLREREAGEQDLVEAFEESEQFGVLAGIAEVHGEECGELREAV